MDMIILLLAIATSASTLVGGSAAVILRKYLRYFFAFAAGTLVAVTFFSILPESLSIATSLGLAARNLMIVLVGTFLLYSLIDRYFLTHHHENDAPGHIMGPIGAAGLSIHSFFDGVAIGAAFQLSPHVGIVVAFAIIFHDFTDGINTVALMLKNKQALRRAMIFLLIDAAAPIAGVITASFFAISQLALAFLLAAFSGEFLYISATNLLPETYKHGSWKMPVSMALGILLIFALTSIA